MTRGGAGSPGSSSGKRARHFWRSMDQLIPKMPRGNAGMNVSYSVTRRTDREPR